MPVRYVSTAHRIVRYAISVPHSAEHGANLRVFRDSDCDFEVIVWYKSTHASVPNLWYTSTHAAVPVSRSDTHTHPPRQYPPRYQIRLGMLPRQYQHRPALAPDGQYQTRLGPYRNISTELVSRYA
eukprot:1835356-Rhodomonas_salina.1